eukprot:scaffold536891_cov18-Prasinocladus_malaysianus.AAC.1
MISGGNLRVTYPSCTCCFYEDDGRHTYSYSYRQMYMALYFVATVPYGVSLIAASSGRYHQRKDAQGTRSDGYGGMTLVPIRRNHVPVRYPSLGRLSRA